MAIMDFRAHRFQYGVGDPPRSLAELEIMNLEGAMRDKPNWWIKIHDATIVERWRSEWVSNPYQYSQFEYALAENRWLASQYSQTVHCALPAAVEGVFGTDTIPALLLQRLVQHVAVLRAQPAIGSTTVDRHPGTPAMVNLIHPSLYCYERGRTAVLGGAQTLRMPPWQAFLGDGGRVEDPPTRHHPLESPSGLQWLPSEFLVRDGATCDIHSYINGLHPIEYPDMYDSIGSLFVKALPLLENVLTDLKYHQNRPHRIAVDSDWYRESEPREQGSDEDDFDYYEYYENFMDQREFVPPTIPTFVEPQNQAPDQNQYVSLRDRPLQVIVKLASLELDPSRGEDESHYSGGTWHVEGTLNERIVATACCYLESQNVTGGKLSFRNSVCEPNYEQDDHDGVYQMYGLENGEPLVQELGSCSTPAGRILAWPNTLQHRVDPVTLQDESRPGKRTICCFFLVDPTLRIRSTATVPPQQFRWIANVMHPILGKVGFSEEAIRHKIVDLVKSTSTLTYEEACERRQRLMDERRAIFQEGDTEFFERPFSLCEH